MWPFIFYGFLPHHLHILNHTPSVAQTKLLILFKTIILGFLGGSDGKESPAMLVTWVPSMGWEVSLEEGMATHSSILARRIPRTEEPGRLQSM